MAKCEAAKESAEVRLQLAEERPHGCQTRTAPSSVNARLHLPQQDKPLFLFCCLLCSHAIDRKQYVRVLMRLGLTTTQKLREDMRGQLSDTFFACKVSARNGQEGQHASVVRPHAQDTCMMCAVSVSASQLCIRPEAGGPACAVQHRILTNNMFFFVGFCSCRS